MKPADSNSERADRRGDFVFGRKTVLALRGRGWICRGSGSRASSCPRPSAILSLSVAIVSDLSARCWRFFSRKSRSPLPVFSPAEKLALALVTAFLVHGSNYPGVTFIVGGIIGAILLLALFRLDTDCLSAVVGRI